MTKPTKTAFPIASGNFDNNYQNNLSNALENLYDVEVIHCLLI